MISRTSDKLHTATDTDTDIKSLILSASVFFIMIHYCTRFAVWWLVADTT